MTTAPVILFDGVCNLCNRVVRLVVQHDKQAYFKLAPLQSEAGQALLQKHNLPKKDFETFLLIDNGQVFQKSTAALKVMHHFSWYWQVLRLLWLVPAPLRDVVYSFIARHRYQWFGKKDVCMLPDANMKKHFL